MYNPFGEATCMPPPKNGWVELPKAASTVVFAAKLCSVKTKKPRNDVSSGWLSAAWVGGGLRRDGHGRQDSEKADRDRLHFASPSPRSVLRASISP